MTPGSSVVAAVAVGRDSMMTMPIAAVAELVCATRTNSYVRDAATYVSSTDDKGKIHEVLCADLHWRNVEAA